jgi:hypothetical protein
LFLRAGVNVFYSWPSLVSPSFSVGWSFWVNEANFIKFNLH